MERALRLAVVLSLALRRSPLAADSLIADLKARVAVLEARLEAASDDADPPPPIPVLGVASIFHAGYLLRCVRSIDFPVQTLVVVHNGEDPGVAAAIETLQRERPRMRVVRVPQNSGCAGGWNRILAADERAPWWLVVNDDIAFPRGALRNIAARVHSRVASRPEEGHFKFWYQHGATGWSAFALTARAVERVGLFDENVYPVYFEDQDYEWRLERAGLASVHLRDTLVVHGGEDAEEYESGSMVALHNGTGDDRVREAFTAALLRGANRAYMEQKWGAIKPRDGSGEPERRWHTPFNRKLPLSWAPLDAERRACILLPPEASAAKAGSQSERTGAPCPFNERLADDAEARASDHEPRPRPGGGGSRFEQRLGRAGRAGRGGGGGGRERDEL